ncbi:hypothetical protein DMA11_20670 [Marinilabiliaceae bacterium JC017]|nr:hypothetical protein DMA11_20670 [Marinilabiliaceae bacterium JC017]
MDLKKNPKMVYLLGALVIVIWAAIFIRFFSYQNTDYTFRIKPNHKIKEAKTVKRTTDYKLLLNYDDPFLKKGQVPVCYTSGSEMSVNDESLSLVAEKRVIEEKRKDEATTNNIPAIEYHGMISNTSQQKKVAILEVGKVRCIMEEGDKKGGIKILTIQQDSLILLFENTELVYKKH